MVEISFNNPPVIDRELQLAILRQTECRPFYTIGVVQFYKVSRKEFIESAKKFAKESEGKPQKYDKMIIIGRYNGIEYNRIQLIKFIEDGKPS